MKFTFYDGIKNYKPCRYLTLQEVYEFIQNSPNAGLIETIRTLKSNNDDSYRELKLRLPLITPHVQALGRKLKGDDFEKNFQSFTQLMYFDIDNVQNVHDEKQRIINQYKDFVTMVCISPSGAGISILIQIENEITKDNFTQIWNSIRLNEFSNENIDVKAIGIARTMFLSYDPQVYFNPDATLTVDFVSEEKVGIDPITYFYKKDNNNINSHFFSNKSITKEWYKIYNIDYVLTLINTNTQVDVNDNIVDVKEVQYYSIYIPKIIPEGKRHKTLYVMIHRLFHLNPDLDIDVIYSYLWYINSVFVRPKLDKLELYRHFNYVVNQINISGINLGKKRVRRIHFNKNCKSLTSNDKMVLAKKLTGLYKRYHNQQKIIEAIELLKTQGKKVTNMAIKSITGNDIKTIRNHRKSEIIDLDFEISELRNEFYALIPNQLSA